MRYDLLKENEKQNAIQYFKKVLDSKKRIELKVIHKKRSLPQNAYLHVLFSVFGLEVGLTVEETKTDIKRALNYVYEKQGKKYLSKTSKMDSKELTIFIEKFKKYASEQGIGLPEPNQINDTLLNYIESNKIYL